MPVSFDQKCLLPNDTFKSYESYSHEYEKQPNKVIHAWYNMTDTIL